jgi:pilus assembly protein Flp/PilA
VCEKELLVAKNATFFRHSPFYHFIIDQKRFRTENLRHVNSRKILIRIVNPMAPLAPEPEAFMNQPEEYDMHLLIAVAKEFARDEDGITAIEYGLIAATMVAAVVAAFGFLTPALTGAFEAIADKITSP